LYIIYNVGNRLASFLFQLVAIGPTTAEAAFSEYKLKVWSVASKPTPEHLLEAVLKL
jgi:uroporphyrinogen-III synthase